MVACTNCGSAVPCAWFRAAPCSLCSRSSGAGGRPSSVRHRGAQLTDSSPPRGRIRARGSFREVRTLDVVPHADPHTEERQHATHHLRSCVWISLREFQPQTEGFFNAPATLRRYASSCTDPASRFRDEDAHQNEACRWSAFFASIWWAQGGGCDFGRCGLGGTYGGKGQRGTNKRTPAFLCKCGCIFMVNQLRGRSLRRKRHPAHRSCNCPRTN